MQGMNPWLMVFRNLPRVPLYSVVINIMKFYRHKWDSNPDPPPPPLRGTNHGKMVPSAAARWYRHYFVRDKRKQIYFSAQITPQPKNSLYITKIQLLLNHYHIVVFVEIRTL